TPAPRLDEVTALANDWRLGQRPSTEALDALTADEWRAFLASLPDVLPLEEIAWCEQTRSLSTSKNAEIRVGWLAIAARSNAQSLFDAIEATLLEFGRMKYLRPLYEGLAKAGPKGKARASTIFERAKDKYHPVARALAARLVA
ncbi:MAG: leukotriene A4 hydrolase C-terminal domain-containing protein, partial [Myxococcota bacterium]